MPRSNRSGTESGDGRQLVGMQGLEQGRARDDGADVGTGPLVGARGVEVGAESGDIDRSVRCRVHTVDIGERPEAVRLLR